MRPPPHPGMPPWRVEATRAKTTPGTIKAYRPTVGGIPAICAYVQRNGDGEQCHPRHQLGDQVVPGQPSEWTSHGSLLQHVDLTAGEAVDRAKTRSTSGPSLLREDFAQLGFLIGGEVASDQVPIELPHALLDPVDDRVGAEEEQG